MSADLSQAVQARTASVVEPAPELIRHPSRAGIDDYGPILGVLEDWLAARALPHRRLYDDAGHWWGCWWRSPAAVRGNGGRWTRAWTQPRTATRPPGPSPPASGEVVDGSLLGRGSSDSKLAAAMFCHIAADLHSRAADLHGGLAVLLDVDEHTGGFGGARAYLADRAVARPSGVMIGYRAGRGRGRRSGACGGPRSTCTPPPGTPVPARPWWVRSPGPPTSYASWTPPNCPA
ncbi:M20/M25/M40 family metallo-hydrolase [Streptomyces sp. NBC_01005]|uniref:M20/M25/M40 family metallo-hydrolase n=1 Tax=unclassified Streptomyces TaxID=2593676 RepID=UPI0038701E4B|nr:M20/M25/M40 family metallo-hydrolase [Streptomyces sp. NBC_01005]WTC99752.1 M20/M25/M40 family metallo-hydrolase [Streptomyces sp. NBC_01650]